MVGAGALSMKKERYTPRKDATTATMTAIASMALNLRVTRKAMAPGKISMAMARMMPTAFKAPTMVRIGSPAIRSAAADRQSDRSRLRRVECVQEKVPPFDEDDAGRNGRDDPGFDDIAETRPEDVAKQNVIEMHVALDLDVKHESQPEHAREHDPDHRVLLDAAVLLRKPVASAQIMPAAKAPMA